MCIGTCDDYDVYLYSDDDVYLFVQVMLCLSGDMCICTSDVYLFRCLSGDMCICTSDVYLFR